MLSGKSRSSARTSCSNVVVVAQPALRHQVEEARLGLPGAAREKRPQRFARIAVAPLEIIDLRKPQRHQLGVVSLVACGLRRRKLVARIRVPAAAEQALAATHLELVARVAGRDWLHLRQRLQRTLCLGSVLAEWKFVVQVQVGVGCALRIAVGQRRIGKAQPDGRNIDGGFVEDVLVDFRGVAEIAQRVSRLGLAERRGFADESWRLLQCGKSLPRRFEPAEPQLGHAGVVRRVRTQRRFRRCRS